MKKPKTPHIITVKEGAALLRVATMTIYRQVGLGRLPHFRVGTRIMFDQDVLLKHFIGEPR